MIKYRSKIKKSLNQKNQGSDILKGSADVT